MDLTFVGCGDAFGSGGRFQTCLRLYDHGHTALVDCGATSMTALKSAGLDPQQVDSVVLSHLHADHFGGLPFLILDGQFARRTKKLTIVGPAGTESRLRTAMEAAFPGSTRVRRRFAIDVVEIDGDGATNDLGPVRVAGWEVDHPSGAPSLALNVSLGGSTFGYSGDTAWTPALPRAAEHADLFACEAYTYVKVVPYHLDYPTLVERAGELGTGRLVLTHLGPTMLDHLDDIELTTAYDGMRLAV